MQTTQQSEQNSIVRTPRRDLSATRTKILELAATEEGFLTSMLTPPEFPKEDVNGALKGLVKRQKIFGQRYGNGSRFVYFDSKERLTAFLERHRKLLHENSTPSRARKAGIAQHPNVGIVNDAPGSGAVVDMSKAKFTIAPRNFVPYVPPQRFDTHRAGANNFRTIPSKGIDSAKE